MTHGDALLPTLPTGPGDLEANVAWPSIGTHLHFSRVDLSWQRRQ
jgi:hypothetical protein